MCFQGKVQDVPEKSLRENFLRFGNSEHFLAILGTFGCSGYFLTFLGSFLHSGHFLAFFAL